MRHNVLAAAFVLSAPLFLTPPSFAEDALLTERFVEKVGISDLFEVEAGRIAGSQAQLPAIKAFGKRMVDDHSQTTDQLKSLVSDNDIKAQLPTALDDKHQAKLDKLKGLSGNEFDENYIEGQVKAHEKAVDMFQAYSQSGDNAKLKDWAQSTLPALRNHLEEAKTLEKEVDKAPVIAANDEKTTEAVDKQAKTGERAADTKSSEPTKSTINYITRQAPTDWSAQALIGRSVQNPNGETLGDINNVILNEKGDVVAVTIGVGGFLGIGEKDVGVPFDNLDFRATGVAADRTYGTADGKDERAEEKRERAKDAREARYDSEHENIDIVLNATREQLEKAPSFVWLDQQDSTGKRSERSTE
jgi:putative membrane protein